MNSIQRDKKRKFVWPKSLKPFTSTVWAIGLFVAVAWLAVSAVCNNAWLIGSTVIYLTIWISGLAFVAGGGSTNINTHMKGALVWLY